MAAAWERTPPAVLLGLVALVAFDLALLALAWQRGSGEIRDGAGTVTNGMNVFWSLLAVGAAVAAWQMWRIPLRLKRAAQAFGLAAIAAHAAGHLFGVYYAWRPFDDVLHAVITALAAVLTLRHTQALGLFPVRLSHPLRTALFTVVLALALAGAWEIFEFTMDEFTGTREQDDLRDTMQDMIAGFLGGVVIAGWSYARPKPPGTRTGPPPA